jgi:glycosyltransferase involved in cell wall biosynthesis
VLATNSYIFGGVEEHVILLAGALESAGFEPIVLSAKTHGLEPLTTRLEKRGIRHLESNLNGGPLREQIQICRDLLRLFGELKPDVLHVHLTGYDGGRLPIAAGLLGRVPTVVTHHIAPSGVLPMTKRLARLPFLLGVKAFISVSEASRRAQIERMGLPPARTRRIHNGIALSPPFDRNESRRRLRQILAVPFDAPLVGLVGRVAPQKGHRYLLEAAPGILARVPDARFVFVGEGPDRAAIETLAAEKGLSDTIHWLGFRADAAELLAGLNVLAMPSEFEGLPITLIEAMAQGIAVVAHAVDGIPEAIRDGEEGFLIPRGDTTLLAERVTRLLLDSQQADRMGSAGRMRMQRDFTASAMAGQTAEIYRQAMERRAPER